MVKNVKKNNEMTFQSVRALCKISVGNYLGEAFIKNKFCILTDVKMLTISST